MKNIIKIIALIFIVTISFTTILDSKSGSKFNLNSLLLVNNANAEINENGEVEDDKDCTYTDYMLPWPWKADGTKTDCPSGAGRCSTISCGPF